MGTKARRPGDGQYSLFYEAARCDSCLALDVCGAAHTSDACDEPSLYGGGITLRDVGEFTQKDFVLDMDVGLRSIPTVGNSLVIGDRFREGGCDAVRLKSLLDRVFGDRRGQLAGAVGVMHGADDQLVRLGDVEGQIGAGLLTAGLRFAIGPAYSTWTFWSPLDTLVGMRYSTHFVRVLSRHLPTVPSVIWKTHRDLQRWADWIEATGAQAVAVDLGTFRRPWEWSFASDGVSELDEELARRSSVVRLFINGPSSIERLVELRSAWRGPMTFMSQHPWLVAQHGRILNDRLEEDQAVDAPFEELLRFNRQSFDRAVDSVIDRRPFGTGRNSAAS